MASLSSHAILSGMLRQLFAVFMLLGWASAQSKTSLNIGGQHYSVIGKQLEATDLRSGRVLWVRHTSTSNFRWLAEYRGVVVGVGTLTQNLPIGGNTYSKFDISHYFGFEAKTGKQLWSWNSGVDSRDTHWFNGLLAVTVPDGAYAFNTTNIIDSVSGNIITSTKGDFRYKDDSQLVVGCEISSFPYCQDTTSFSVLRITNSPRKTESWTFDLKMWPKCGYIDMPLYYHTRYTKDYFEILLSDGCGYLLSRYFWANGPAQKPIQQRINEQTWPVGFPRPAQFARR